MTDRDALAALLAEHRLHRSINICMCGTWRATANAGSLVDQHDAHLADVIAPLIEQARREGAWEALMKAADDVTYEARRLEVGCEADIGYYDAYMEIQKMLRDRAERYATDTEEPLVCDCGRHLPCRHCDAKED